MTIMAVGHVTQTNEISSKIYKHLSTNRNPTIWTLWGRNPAFGQRSIIHTNHELDPKLGWKVIDFGWRWRMDDASTRKPLTEMGIKKEGSYDKLLHLYIQENLSKEQ